MTVIEEIEEKIYLIRGQKVMLDSDLAVIYGVETKMLNRAVKRILTVFRQILCFNSPMKKQNL